MVEGACTVDCGSANRIVCDTDQVPTSWRRNEAGDTIELADVDTGEFFYKHDDPSIGNDHSSIENDDFSA